MTFAETQWSLHHAQEDETRRLRKNGLFVGLSLLGILAVQLGMSLLLAIPLTQAEANINASAEARLLYYALYVGYYCAMLLLPVGVLALIFRRSPRPAAARAQLSIGDAVLAIAFGLAFCVLANYLVNYWLQFLSLFGIEPFQGEYHNDSGWLPLVLNLFTYALLPGLIEELVFRGWLLSALQPFGERRALLLSALIFGLMHGNLTQVPFALLLGLLFGFVTLRTGKLWPCMIIHTLNNAMSVALDYAGTNAALSENQTILLQMAVFIVLVALGTVAGLILRHRGSPLTHPLTDRRSVLTAAQRSRMMWFSPTIVIGVVALAALTVLQELML